MGLPPLLVILIIIVVVVILFILFNSRDTSSFSTERYIVTTEGVNNTEIFGRQNMRHVIHSAFDDGYCTTLTKEQAEDAKTWEFIRSVEPDFKVTAAGFVSTQAQSTPWGVQRIAAKTSNIPIDVYVIDTGVSHPDINVVEKISYVSYESVEDLNGHGTHVAGTIGAINNTNYVIGVAPNVRIHSLKVLDAQGSGYSSSVISALNLIRARKLASPSTPIIANMSLGGYTGSTGYNALDNAVNACVKAGVICCVAAGNSSSNANTYSPAHVADAITVGAYDINNTFAYFSNYGPLVDIHAPGVNILSTYKGNSLVSMSGTSMATPHVSGVVAYYLSKNPKTTPTNMKLLLQTNSKINVKSVPTGTTNKSVYVV